VGSPLVSGRRSGAAGRRRSRPHRPHRKRRRPPRACQGPADHPDRTRGHQVRRRRATTSRRHCGSDVAATSPTTANRPRAHEDDHEHPNHGVPSVSVRPSASRQQPRLQILRTARGTGAGRGLGVEHEVVKAPRQRLPDFSTASSGSDATIQRLATCSIAARSAPSPSRWGRRCCVSAPRSATAAPRTGVLQRQPSDRGRKEILISIIPVDVVGVLRACRLGALFLRDQLSL